MKTAQPSAHSLLDEHHPLGRFVELARPALRISNVVCGRESHGTRVSYRLDPQGVKPERDIPEQVVLQRWRQRRLRGHVLSGSRLSPTVWRALAHAFGTDAEDICRQSTQQIAEWLGQYRARLRDDRLKLPNEEVIAALVEACGPVALQALLDRHTAPGRGTRSGVPDLFLYARHSQTKRLATPVFVEVKKPKEQISGDQRSEIAFMLKLGLSARVLVLIER